MLVSLTVLTQGTDTLYDLLERTLASKNDASPPTGAYQWVNGPRLSSHCEFVFDNSVFPSINEVLVLGMSVLLCYPLSIPVWPLSLLPTVIIGDISDNFRGIIFHFDFRTNTRRSKVIGIGRLLVFADEFLVSFLEGLKALELFGVQGKYQCAFNHTILQMAEV